jgi:uncharacterized damage-inducible protein DinB
MTNEQIAMLGAMFTGMLEREYQTTRRVLQSLPEDKAEFTPNPIAMTARKLMWHIASSEAWFGQGIVAGSFDQPEPAMPEGITCAGIVEWYDKTLPPVIEKIKTLPPEALGKELNFFNVFNMPAVYYMGFWNSHSIHHRGQFSTYLRCVGARVPSIYGGSADEPFQMATA